MRSPFSKFSARSRMSLMIGALRKNSQSDKSDYHLNSSVDLNHCSDCAADRVAKTDALLETLYTYLDQDHPESPLYYSPFKIKNSDVQRWADSVSPYVMSPTEMNPEFNGHQTRQRSLSLPSSAGSLLSNDSSNGESGGPRTPTFNSDVLLSSPRLPTIADVRSVAMPLQTPATNEAVPKIHRAFSFELVPDSLSRPAPPQPNKDTRDEHLPTLIVEGSNTTTHLDNLNRGIRCIATITNPADQYMPEYIPSPRITPTQKKSSYPLLRIDTQVFHSPTKHSSQASPPGQPSQTTLPKVSEHEPTPPTLPELQLGEMMSLGYQAYLETRTDQDRRLLSYSERQAPSSRHSIANFSQRGNLNYTEYRKGANRYSVQAPPSQRLLNDLKELQLIAPSNHQSYVPDQVPCTSYLNSRPRDVPQLTIQAPRPSCSITKDQNVSHLAVTSHKTCSVPTIQRDHQLVSKRPQRRSQAEIEAIPVSNSSSTKLEEPVAFATNRGIFFSGGFFAKEKGLQIKMTRIVTTGSRLEWVIQDLHGSKNLKCFAQTNSLSSKKDFFDGEGNLLFSFQKRIGSTRIAETPSGIELFSVRNASLPSMPHWTVKLLSGINDSSASWIAKGDDDMGSLCVRWGGFEVGSIRSGSNLKKHTYIVSIAPEMNYAVMAALATVFDDLRTDEGC